MKNCAQRMCLCEVALPFIVFFCGREVTHTMLTPLTNITSVCAQRRKNNNARCTFRRADTNGHRHGGQKKSRRVKCIKDAKSTNQSTQEVFVHLKRKQPKYKLQNKLIGKLIDGNKFYEWKSYNTFASKPRILKKTFLDKFENKSITAEQINDTYYGDKKTIEDMSFDKSIHNGYTNKTFIQHNGRWLCMVCYKQKSAFVFIINNEDDLIIEADEYEYDWIYTKLLFTFPYMKVFEASDTSDEYETEQPGNTILLQNDEHRYTYIGAEIYQFHTDDIIEKYYCAEFSSWVPYPVAIGSKQAYFLLDHTCVPMRYMRNIDSSEWYKAYLYYFGIEGNKSQKLSKHAKKMKHIKCLTGFDR